ncbi:tetratricopeptide repeat protein [Dyadobacter subterraneus]|uniref:Tetratricopeptide repeat protein n=1 Tax=Dyadobacter subterraneus TaxID=2773304 RepID=A0ABR9WCV4_9BACT|nr:tetratricopeptide repeat protein [Dyadobacter subterraneus]MBE9463305.1 tetratricopeptide repeat protein [Dyadobacter subterraneus]
MNALLLYLLLLLWDNRTFDAITKTNERKIGAEMAFKKKQFVNASKLYHQITYGSVFSDPAARLNMAHSYYQAGQLKDALYQYKLLDHVKDKTIASVANCQVALILVSKKDTAGALERLKTSLRLEPRNTVARSNYIILKTHFSGIEQPSQSSQDNRMAKNEASTNKPTPSKPEAKPEGFEQEEAAKREQLLRSLKSMNMSEEQARLILDAMKSNESQYIYQLRRKQYAKKSERNETIEW